LPSKVRYISAQFIALLENDLWIANARHANDMAQVLYAAVRDVPGVELSGPPAVNSLYPSLPPALIEPLRDWSFFYDWDVHHHQVRWMTAWDTTPADVEAFAQGVRHFAAPA